MIPRPTPERSERLVNPIAIAKEINGNQAAYEAGIINRARWDAEQSRLWKEAADAGLASVVLAMVAPSLTEAKR